MCNMPRAHITIYIDLYVQHLQLMVICVQHMQPQNYFPTTQSLWLTTTTPQTVSALGIS